MFDSWYATIQCIISMFKKYKSLLSIVIHVHLGILETKEGDKYEIHVHDLAKKLEQYVPRSGKLKTLNMKTFRR